MFPSTGLCFHFVPRERSNRILLDRCQNLPSLGGGRSDLHPKAPDGRAGQRPLPGQPRRLLLLLVVVRRVLWVDVDGGCERAPREALLLLLIPQRAVPGQPLRGALRGGRGRRPLEDGGDGDLEGEGGALVAPEVNPG